MNAKPSHVRLSDIRGASQLAIDATLGVTDLIETLHRTIQRTPGILGKPTRERTAGVTGMVYRSIRGITKGIGGGIDLLLRQLIPAIAERESSAEREAILAALNGVLGDHLRARDNPLRIAMSLRRDGRALELTPAGLKAAMPRATGKILLLAHGLCMGDRQWRRNGHEHGPALAEALGVTIVHVNYNTGLAVGQNGHELAAKLEALLAAWPVRVEQMDILGYSMGGLVTRAACHYGQADEHGWVKALRKIVFLGTPHHGAPLERGGKWIDEVLEFSPYTAAFARLGKIRSAGIMDLRHGLFLESPKGSTVPLPPGVNCYAVAGVIADDPEHLIGVVGDGLVLRDSALGRSDDPARCLPIPPDHQWTCFGAHHLDLLERPAVLQKLVEFLA